MATTTPAWLKIIGLIAIIVVVVFLVALLVLAVLSYRAERRADNTAFHNGKYPDAPLDGAYDGKFDGKTDWLGKKFDATNSKGINIFSGDKERFVFTTERAKTLKGDQEVLHINYNQPGNPFWLRFIVDELVQTDAGKYQGKVFIKIGPLDFTLTYFKLSERQ